MKSLSWPNSLLTDRWARNISVLTHGKDQPPCLMFLNLENDHVLRHGDISSPTDQEKQWKSLVSDHGVIVLEFIRML